MINIRACALALLVSAWNPLPAVAQSDEAPGDERSVEQVVRDVYDMVSWTDGDTPDWEEVRQVFLPEAVVVLRNRAGLQVMSVDGFLLDWLRFQNQLTEAGLTGFVETVRSADVTEFGDIAHAHVVYESSIPETERPARPGVDFWSLIRVDGVWKVASVVNELPRDGVPIPESFRE